jgi:hypothetical protein
MLSLLLTIVVNISMICCKDILAEEIINVEIVVDYCWILLTFFCWTINCWVLFQIYECFAANIIWKKINIIVGFVAFVEIIVDYCYTHYFFWICYSRYYMFFHNKTESSLWLGERSKQGMVCSTHVTNTTRPPLIWIATWLSPACWKGHTRVRGKRGWFANAQHDWSMWGNRSPYG